jgi:hypothetical protein
MLQMRRLPKLRVHEKPELERLQDAEDSRCDGGSVEVELTYYPFRLRNKVELAVFYNCAKHDIALLFPDPGTCPDS